VAREEIEKMTVTDGPTASPVDPITPEREKVIYICMYIYVGICMYICINVYLCITSPVDPITPEREKVIYIYIY
jgi:hypothetical protein